MKRAAVFSPSLASRLVGLLDEEDRPAPGRTPTRRGSITVYHVRLVSATLVGTVTAGTGVTVEVSSVEGISAGAVLQFGTEDVTVSSVSGSSITADFAEDHAAAEVFTIRTGGRYAGKRVTFDSSDNTWDDADDVWVVEANGYRLEASTRYGGIRSAVVAGVPVWTVHASSGTDPSAPCDCCPDTSALAGFYEFTAETNGTGTNGFSDDNNNSFSLPAGCDLELIIECWGRGGYHEGSFFGITYMGGDGGGAYAKKTVTVPGGSSVTVRFRESGDVEVVTDDINNPICRAKGGEHVLTAGGGGENGGQGGQAAGCIGDVVYSGGDGGDADESVGGGGGGAGAGPGGNGNPGQDASAVSPGEHAAGGVGYTLGGVLYSSGGDGESTLNAEGVLAQEPGGGTGGQVNTVNTIFNATQGLCRIRWGSGVVALNGQSGPVTLVSPTGVEASGSEGIVTLPPVDLADADSVTGILPPPNGGLGLDASTATVGQVPMATGSGFELVSLGTSLAKAALETTGVESGDGIEIAFSLEDFQGNALETPVDIQLIVSDAANDSEPSATATIGPADTPVGTITSGSGTATVTVRTEADGTFAVKVTETAAANRYVWIKQGGNAQLWVASKQGTIELTFS